MSAPAAAAPRTVHAILPGDIDDPTRPSGGNTYDRRVCHGLADLGWRVREAAVDGTWPRPDAAARTGLARALAAAPDGAVVLLDGLVACGAPETVVPHAHRLRLAVLVHLPLADEAGLAPETAADLDARERRTLRAASAVVATSPWAARQLAHRHGLPRARLTVATPGVDPAPLALGTDGASRLLCVAAVTPTKGHDLLVRALAAAAGRPSSATTSPWTCRCVGALARDPGHVRRLRRLVHRLGLDDRVRLTGPLTGERLASEYAAADLVVLPSRVETYGMVLTEALARGIPVLATAVGGVPDTLAPTPDGTRPGLLVPPEATALAGALRRWFAEPDLRDALTRSARDHRGILGTWDQTSRTLAGVLDRLRTPPPRPG